MNYMKLESVYAAYVNSDEILKSSSGGVAFALSTKFIKDGGYVVGVKYNKNFRKAIYAITNNLADINDFNGSKYIDAEIGTIFHDVQNLLKSGKKVLFIGLPCKISALYLFLKIAYTNLYTCSLICHGPTKNSVHVSYIEFLEKKFHSKIVSFSVRAKKDKWVPFYLCATFENGEKFEKMFNETAYGRAFYLMSLDRCYNCKFKGDNCICDLQIGDFWGCNKNNVFYNDKGVSCILAKTKKGNLLVNANPYLSIFEVNIKDVLIGNPHILVPVDYNNERAKFKNNFEKKGLFFAVRKSYGIKFKIKLLVIFVLKLLHLK